MNKINDKLNSNNELNSIIENCIDELISIIENSTLEAIEKVINSIKEEKVEEK